MIIGILALLYFLYASKRSLLKKVDGEGAHATRTIKLEDALFARAPEEKHFKAAIGASVENIYNINLEDASFYASGYIYLRYTQVPSWLEDWDSEIYDSPVKSLTFTNAIYTDFTEGVTPTNPVKDVKGNWIQWKYFAGKFKINHSDIYSPFRPIRVNLDFELDDFYAGDCLLMLDVSEPDAIIETDKGLSVISANSSLLARQYNTNWGYQYSNQAFGVRNKTFFHLLRLEIILDQEASSALWEQILFVAASSICELYFLLTSNASILACFAAGFATLCLLLIGKPIIEKNITSRGVYCKTYVNRTFAPFYILQFAFLFYGVAAYTLRSLGLSFSAAIPSYQLVICFGAVYLQVVAVNWMSFQGRETSLIVAKDRSSESVD